MSNLSRLLVTTLVIVAADAGSAAAQILNVSSGSVFTQNFDTLITTSTGFFNQFDSGGPTLGNAFAVRTASSNSYAASTGSSGTGNLYSFGAVSATERALGSVGSSSGTTSGSFAYGFVFRNTGTEALNINVQYVGEQWRNSGAGEQTISFSYRTTTTAPTIATLPAIPTANNTDPIGFTSVDALDFTSPITGGTAGALDGNLTANRVAFNQDVAVAVPVNAYLTLYFSDPDHFDNDHGLAIDNVRVAFTPVPEPATLLAVAAGGLGLARLRRRLV